MLCHGKRHDVREDGCELFEWEKGQSWGSSFDAIFSIADVRIIDDLKHNSWLFVLVSPYAQLFDPKAGGVMCIHS
jgi:hypothetical protein